MKVATGEPVLECHLDEFWSDFWSQQNLGIVETLHNATQTFRGESSINPRFRIRTPDGKGDLFFNSPELLCRFAGFPTPTQQRFLDSIRLALAKNHVNQVVITVPWSKDGERRIQIRSSGASMDGASMDFEVLN